jgi:hypothetical protein
VLKDIAEPLRAAEVFAWMDLRKEAKEKPQIEGPGRPTIVTFGDNIVLAWDRPEVTDSVLLGFTQPILHLIVKGMGAGLLLRGAVSFGEFILDGTTIIGPALSDAVAWMELADWVGVVATPKLGLRVDAEEEKWKREFPNSAYLLDSFYVKYPVPLKGGGCQNMWCFAWPAKVRSLLVKSGLDQGAGREHLLRWLSQCSVPAAAKSKYDNTIAFYDWYSARVDKK